MPDKHRGDRENSKILREKSKDKHIDKDRKKKLKHKVNLFSKRVKN